MRSLLLFFLIYLLPSILLIIPSFFIVFNIGLVFMVLLLTGFHLISPHVLKQSPSKIPLHLSQIFLVVYLKVPSLAHFWTLDSRSGSKDLWAAVKGIKNKGQNEIIADNVDATVLNNHYATISSDSNYSKPCQKSSAALRTTPFSEYEVFKLLDRLKPTATGLDKLPAWYLRLGAPVFAKPLANLFNRSIQDSVVPTQWKAAYIRLVQKIPTPTQPSDYRPISITPVLSRMMEKMVVKEFIYPAMNDPPPELSFSDQFAFKPASTTAAIIDMFQAIIEMLQTNPYVIVIALDFSKAFDTVRHASVADKMAKLNMSDNVYNWIIDFLEGHSHQTNFGGRKSQFLKISASIIQGSGLGPATYSVVASDLRPLFPGNRLFKFADDTYLVIPASNVNSRCLELKHVQDWATANNLQLNTKKSQEMVFTKPRGRNTKVVVPAIPDVERVTSLKMLGVIISHNFSMDEHVSAIISSSGQALYALRILKSHGMSNACLQAVYQSTVVSRLTYACQAWRGFASRAALDRLDSFLRRSIKAGFYPSQSPMYEELCEALENGLFKALMGNPVHPLHHLLPPKIMKLRDTRNRSHPYQLPSKSDSLHDKNFVMRMLYRHAY